MNLQTVLLLRWLSFKNGVRNLAANAKRSADFLARNRTRSGVVTLPSGIQYAVLAKGSGPQAQVTSTVVVNYRGALIDGFCGFQVTETVTDKP